MFDAHNHLHFAAFDEDREAAIAAAIDAGVRGMVLAGYDDERQEVAAQLAQRPGIGASAGLHPWAVDSAEPPQFLNEIDWSAFCAVGELGLDWVRAATQAQREDQIAVFRHQLAIARDVDLPVVLHCVRANDDLAAWLKRDGLPTRGGMVHSFWGSAEQAKRFIALGLHLSIGTQLTHAQPTRVIRAIRAVPATLLLAETDAPSRPPPSVEGPRNEPRHLPVVIAALAEVREQTAAEIAKVTDDNARMLFGVRGELC